MPPRRLAPPKSQFLSVSRRYAHYDITEIVRSISPEITDSYHTSAGRIHIRFAHLATYGGYSLSPRPPLVTGFHKLYVPIEFHLRWLSVVTRFTFGIMADSTTRPHFN
jgi:hypothetical protein